MERPSQRPAARLAGGLAALAAALPGCGPRQVAASGEATRAPASLVLVALDSVPARLTGCLGGAPFTPNLDRLARRGLLYTGCIAPEPWSEASLAAALGGGTDADAASLARTLGERGWRTVAVLAHDCMRQPRARGERFERGIGADFDEVVDLGSGLDAGAVCDDVVREALGVVAASGSAPLCLLVHLADARPPHHLYPGLVAEADAPYDGPLTAGLSHTELLRIAPSLTARDLARAEALLASEVAAVDAALGRLLAGIERRPDADDFVIAVFGTRGAWSGADGRLGLVPGLEPDLLHVPLVVAGATEAGGVAGVAPGIVDEVVSLADLAPSLAALLGVERDEEGGAPRSAARALAIRGRSVLPGAPAPPRVVRAMTRRAHPLAAVYGDGALVVRDLESGEERVLPWARVPGAAADAAGAELAAVRADLFVAIDAWLGPSPAKRPPERAAPPDAARPRVRAPGGVR